jgi:hypothetical protein
MGAKVSFFGERLSMVGVLALSEADDLAVGQGDDDLALRDGREDVTGRIPILSWRPARSSP